MEEMRIYISNLAKYNEGESVGAWFTLPVDYEDLAAMFVEDGYLGEIPENIINYIHYGRLGNDLQAQLNTLQLSGCIVEYTG